MKNVQSKHILGTQQQFLRTRVKYAYPMTKIKLLLDAQLLNHVFNQVR